MSALATEMGFSGYNGPGQLRPVAIPGSGNVFGIQDGMPFRGAPTSGRARALDDAGLSSGQTFLTGQLEYQERTLLKPLVEFFAYRDIPVKTGGGFVSNTSNFFVNYATTGGNQYGLVGGQTDNVPVIQGNVTKDLFSVFPVGYIVKTPLMDADRMAQAGIPETLDQILNDGLKITYNKMLDQNGFLGFSQVGTTGLVNNASVTATLVSQTVINPNSVSTAADKRKWINKSAQEILNDINQPLIDAYKAAGYDKSAIPNQIIIPVDQYAYINNTMVNIAANKSILAWIMENNFATKKGVDLVILDNPFCSGAGASGTDRMVTYCRNPKFLHFNITVPLYRKMTQPDVTQDAYLTRYESFVGQTKILAFQTINYYDGI